MTVDNPFFHRGAIRRREHFHGRRAETEQILGLLRNSQSVSLIGPRRIGKSSLLLHLRRAAVRDTFQLGAPHALFLLVDCQELGGSPPEEVYDALLSGLLDAAEEAGIAAGTISQPGTYHALDRALNRITQNGASVVVMLDEFELLAANDKLTPYFFARLRGLTTKYGIAYVTASQKPLFAITADEQILSSPFFNIFVTLPLGLYDEEEARSLLVTRLEKSSFTFSEALIEQIIAFVGPHPFFLHVAGYHTYQALAQGSDPESPEGWAAVVSATEIEADSHLSYLWANLTAEERYTLATIDGPIDNLRLLEQQCLISAGEAGYTYTSEMLHRFVRRQDVKGILQAGPFIVDPQRHQVKAYGKELTLTISQFEIMVCLVNHAGNVVHSAELENAVWGEVLVDDPDRLKTLIRRLRRAIEPYGSWIFSERGVGYGLRPPDL